MVYIREAGRLCLRLEVTRVGEDVNAVFSGGDTPHIGCAVLAVPRPSRADSGKTSSTGSVINVPSHKDEFICRKCAERISSALQCVCVCCGGFHCSGISDEEIQMVIQLADQLTEEAINDIRTCKKTRV